MPSWSCFASHQVERRVVTQLAMAHERQMIKEGNTIRVAVINPEAETLTRRLDRDVDSEEEEEEDNKQGIKIQVRLKGKCFSLTSRHQFGDWLGALV